MASTKTGVSFQSLMIRLNAAGVPDPTFGTGGRTVLFHPNIVEIKGIKQMPNGQILFIGQSNLGGGGCMLLNSNGSVDSTFGNMGYMTADIDVNAGTHYVRGMQILPNGQWLFGGNGPGFVTSRYDDVSNVPHITQVVSYLQTTGAGTYQWYFNGNAIPGAVHDTLHFTQNGSYTVLLTGDYGCSYLSDPFIVTNSGWMEVAESELIAFPNPVHGTLYVQLRGDEKSLVLTSAEGKEILNKEVKAGISEYILDLSEYSPGMYILTSRSNDTVTVKRIIKL
jgi:hypothetical protein